MRRHVAFLFLMEGPRANPMVPLIALRTLVRRWISRLGSAFAHQEEFISAKLPLPRHQTAEIRAVVMTFSRQDHQALENIAETYNWQIVFAGRWTDILHLARDHKTGVVLLSREVLGGDWKDAVRSLLQPAQRCSVILIGSTISDRLSENFIEEGGYSVLKTPLRDTEVVPAVQCAWAFWKDCIAQAYRH